MDYAMMFGLVVAMFAAVACQAKYHTDGNQNFFDAGNSKAMRGLWCLIVVLVHIPVAYQNKIQDMLGSFAYIGVTFFFMTSSFGLSMKIKKSPQSIKKFWRNRLPKLLVPMLVVNVLFSFIYLIVWDKAVTFRSVFSVNSWIKWLLVCYLVFWLTQLLVKNSGRKVIVICAAVAVISLVCYFMKINSVTSLLVWPTEMIGFIWGILLSQCRERITALFEKKWLSKCLVLCVFSALIGVLYLVYKPVLFFGDYLLKIFLGFVIISFILALNTKISIGNRIIHFLGDISLEVYLIHGFIFELVSGIAYDFGSGEYILTCIAATIISAAVVHTVSKKIVKLMYKRIPFLN